jgi:predicted acetyltransferase
MNIDIFIVPYEKKHILRNMLEIYFHDLSIIDNLELNEAGLYGYKYLDYYWTEQGRFPYIITADGHLAGFSLIKNTEADTAAFEVAEFFILKKYRNSGVGKALMDRMFSLHKGNWTIDTSMNNTIAQHFWRNIVNSASNGRYEESTIEDGTRLKWSFKTSKH